MACNGFFECLLKLLNFVLTITGLAMVGYGVYLLVEWTKISAGGDGNHELLNLGRPMLAAVVSPWDDIVEKLPKAWY
ncbi:Tobamovirus multiplication protein 2A, partial [Ananas comosus]